MDNMWWFLGGMFLGVLFAFDVLFKPFLVVGVRKLLVSGDGKTFVEEIDGEFYELKIRKK